MFLPIEFHGQRNLADYWARGHRVGHDWSDLAQAQVTHKWSNKCNLSQKERCTGHGGDDEWDNWGWTIYKSLATGLVRGNSDFWDGEKRLDLWDKCKIVKIWKWIEYGESGRHPKGIIESDRNALHWVESMKRILNWKAKNKIWGRKYTGVGWWREKRKEMDKKVILSISFAIKWGREKRPCGQGEIQ